MKAIKKINCKSIIIFTLDKHCWWFLSTVIATVKIIAISSITWSSAYAQQCSANMVVTTETELNDAINCHNAGGVGDFNSITIANDIILSGTLSPLTLDNPNGALFIGSANSSQVILTGPGSSSTGTIPLLALRSSAKITLQNLKLQAADGAAVLVSDLARDVTLDSISLFDSGTGLEIKAGHVSFLNSDSKGNKRNGIDLENDYSGDTPVLTMRNSEVAFNTAEGIAYNNGDPNEFGSITESTITNNGIGISMVDSNLDVDKSVVRNNTGDGIIATQGDLNIAYSLIEGNDIGINVSGTLFVGSNIFNTGIYSNSVGIQATTGIFVIASSTVSSNDGTGISLGSTGETHIYNSTVSGNGVPMGSDGIVAGGMDLTIASSTIIKNAGDGLVGNPDTKVLSSIIAGNDTANQGFQDCADLGDDTVQNLGSNFDGDNTCGGFGNMPLMIIDPIADNGCENRNLDFQCVLTHNLSGGNPAIGTGDCGGYNAGITSIPSFLADQRGLQRDSVCDAGAIEVISECNGKPVDVYIALGDMPTSGPDVILGTMGPDSITAMGGDDTICGLGGIDIISAGRGMDWVDAGFGDDTVDGGNDNDTIFGRSGVDRLNGGPGDDEIFGGADGDFIWGNSGNDTLHGGSGIDQILGGSGNDIITTGSGGNLNTGMQVYGGGGNDTITGSFDDDEIRGATGNDTIFGGYGNDSLFGGGGNDTIYGQDGADVINGNGSKDTLYGGDGADYIDGGAEDDTIYGGNDSDFIHGRTGNDIIYGGPGGDELHGDGGNDTLFGNRGNDNLFGGGSNDTLNGGSDADICEGQDGADIITGCEFP